MKRLSLFALLTLFAFASVGCATKRYVRNETAPTINKVNELDELTSQNSRNIRDVDTRAQQGIQQVNTRAGEADQKAQAATQTAQQAQQAANEASTGISHLSSQVLNLDNYRPVVETTVHFGFDKYNLSRKAREALDQLGAEIANQKHYIVVVNGNTDSTGPAEYNYLLSQRRADSVINYLVSNYNIPAHKIYVIGLGEDKPATSNTSGKGRAENRRVDVRLMTNVIEPATAAQAQQPSPPRQ
ncbi:MAG: OmpA family protein [Terriglobales bacterium]